MTRYIPVPDEPWSEVIPRLWQGGCLRDGAPPVTFDAVLTLSEQAHRYVPLDPSPVQPDVCWPIEDAAAPDPVLIDRHARWVAIHHREGNTVGVRCDAGLNRSGLIVARALMHLGYDHDEAIGAVRAARGPDALCNPAFVDWLQATPAVTR